VQAYEELLSDAVVGTSACFARRDYMEEAWRIVDPVLDDKTPIPPYALGRWAPRPNQLTASLRGWINPSRFGAA